MRSDQKKIELIGVTKQYKRIGLEDTPALRDVTLTIYPGEYIGLLGMNGSGKSTLVRLFNGLIKPTAGSVSVDGLDTRDTCNILEIRRRVGMVFQNPDNQLISPVVEEEIAFGLENLDLALSDIDSRIDKALQSVGMTEKRHHAPHLLSGGQKQKVALASVLAMLPDYLVLDEPTSMLDPLSRLELLEQLKILNEQGLTIILISHNPEDLLQASRLIVLDDGSVYTQGSPEQVYADEKLSSLGIETPGIYQLIHYLRSKGYPVQENSRSLEKLVNDLC